jgi:gliding motility-associated lipoprotein GldD
MILLNKFFSKAMLLSLFVSLLFGSSCISEEEYYNPKPRGYFRIDLPSVEYQSFDTAFPYGFEFSKHANITPHLSNDAEPFWIDINYPDLAATIYISHKVVKNNLYEYTEDARSFANKHIPKANDLFELIVHDPKSRVFGKIYHIDGSGVASTCQFWVTDSTKNFVRGSVYFNMMPNNDSLAPVIDYLRNDVLHMMNTFEWK